MTINKNQEASKLTIALEGRLDTTTSPQLEAELRTGVNGVTELVFDLEKLDYISSAGLRVLLAAQKVMNKQGEMKIKNVKPEIMEIFDVTGFVDAVSPPDADEAPLAFGPVELSQMDRVEAIRAASGSTLYVYAFASMFVWQEAERYSICISDDAFVVRHGVRGENVYMFPCGSDNGKKRLIDALMSEGSPSFSYVTDEDRAFLENEYPGKFCFIDCRDDYPYLYDKDEQIALAGKNYKTLKSHVHSGLASAEVWTWELLTPDNVPRAIEITREWANARTDGDLGDAAAAEKALRYFDTLKFWGVLFKADGVDAAYIAGIFVTPEIFDTSFCKVLDKRCDSFVKWELCRHLPPEVKTVDSEEDMGLEGLRTHKLMRQPKELIRIWKGVPQ